MKFPRRLFSRCLSGLDAYGNPVIIDKRTFKFMKTQCICVRYRSQSLFEALVEMFPELSKSEIRRLLKGNALKGVLASPNLVDVEGHILTPGWPRFEVIRLGKTKLAGVRWGMLIK